MHGGAYRVRHQFPDAIYKQTPDLVREGIVSFHCWYMCGAEELNTVHSARLVTMFTHVEVQK